MQKRTKEELSKLELSRDGVILFTQPSPVPLKALLVLHSQAAGAKGVGLRSDRGVRAQLGGLGPSHAAALLGRALLASLGQGY